VPHIRPIIRRWRRLYIAWRQSNVRVISVSRRDAVAALDALIGFKS
jgi:hypothetical protein